MSQRNSGHARIDRDAYMTPEWVTSALIRDLEAEGLLPLAPTKSGLPRAIWEPAAGSGQMSAVLAQRGYEVYESDVRQEAVGTTSDFLLETMWPCNGLPTGIGAIITNPPYLYAEEFIERALDLTEARGGLVAMLLKVDFDSAGSRRHLFAEHPAWCRKIVLNDRIFWVEPEDGKGGPSENHAWFVWQWRGQANDLSATIGYGAMPPEDKRALRARMKARRDAAKAAKVGSAS